MTLSCRGVVALLGVWILLVLATSTNNLTDEIHNGFAWYYYRYNSLLVLVTALFLWDAFLLNIIIENNLLSKVLKVIAPLTLGVYLIHDHEMAKRIV